MSSYHFKTTWIFNAPVKEVWNSILLSLAWPTWWKSVKEVTVQNKTADGVGSIIHYVWQGVLPYQLTFDILTTKVDPYHLLEGVASGDVEGIGTWQFEELDDWCKVTYTWDVELRKPFLRFFSPLLKPIFIWNHDFIMQDGKNGLTKLLGEKKSFRSKLHFLFRH